MMKMSDCDRYADFIVNDGSTITAKCHLHLHEIVPVGVGRMVYGYRSKEVRCGDSQPTPPIHHPRKVR